MHLFHDIVLPNNVEEHDLILYGDSKSIEYLLKSLDRLTKESELFKTFLTPQNSKFSKLLTSLKWFDGTISPLEKDPNKLTKHVNNMINNVIKKSQNQSVCLVDFILGDIANMSLKKALALEDQYNEKRLQGLTFCMYKIDVLLKCGIDGMLEFFTRHDQVFILKNNEIFKIHLTKENTQKLLLD